MTVAIHSHAVAETVPTPTTWITKVFLLPRLMDGFAHFAVIGKITDWIIVGVSAPFLRWEDRFNAPAERN